MKWLLSVFICMLSISINAQQVLDYKFTPKNKQRTFDDSNAPVVVIDAAHYNFHKLDGRYQPFAKVLHSDGYKVKENTEKFTKESLTGVDVLVIANALNSKNSKNWDLPNYPAFSQGEIDVIYEWVKNGGALFLIADHMPFAQASESLGAAFGFEFKNGYAEDESNRKSIFKVQNGSLVDHPILHGAKKSERIKSVRTFDGQAFVPPSDAKKLLVFGKNAIIKMPEKSWVFDENTRTESIAGLCQGATLELESGKVAVFGEAGMFTSQLLGPNKKYMGLNAENAEDNEQFLLNLMHWLSKK